MPEVIDRILRHLGTRQGAERSAARVAQVRFSSTGLVSLPFENVLRTPQFRQTLDSLDHIAASYKRRRGPQR
jgi:hypothetical protein